MSQGKRRIFVLYTGGAIGMVQSGRGLRPDAALAEKALLPFSDGLFSGRTGGHCNRADVNMYRDFTAAYNEGRLKTIFQTAYL